MRKAGNMAISMIWDAKVISIKRFLILGIDD
jgi:hypothetical protein